jgi:hypothetical protein
MQRTQKNVYSRKLERYSPHHFSSLPLLRHVTIVAWPCIHATVLSLTGFRLYHRYRKHQLWWDDYFAALALGSDIAFLVTWMYPHERISCKFPQKHIRSPKCQTRSEPSDSLPQVSGNVLDRNHLVLSCGLVSAYPVLYTKDNSLI